MNGIIHTLELKADISYEVYNDIFNHNKLRPTVKTEKNYGKSDKVKHVYKLINSDVLKHGINEFTAIKYPFVITDANGKRAVYRYRFEIIFNPMKAIGEHSRLALYSGSEQYESVSEAFTALMKELNIHPLYTNLDAWEVKRIDYCTNVYLPSQSFVTEYLRLLKHGDIPQSYQTAYEDNYIKLNKKYDSHRNLIPTTGILSSDSRLYREMYPEKGINKQAWGSYWVLGKNDCINIYDKYDQLISKIEKGKQVDPEDTESAKQIIRVEWQCKSKANDLNKRYNEHTEQQIDPFSGETVPQKIKPKRTPSTLMRSGIGHQEQIRMLGRIEVGSASKTWKRYYDCVYLRRKDLYAFIDRLRKEKKISKQRFLHLRQLIIDVNKQNSSIWKVRQERTEGLTKKEAQKEVSQINKDLSILRKYRVSAVTIRDTEQFTDKNGEQLNIKWLPSLSSLLRDSWNPEGKEKTIRKIREECIMKYNPDDRTPTHEGDSPYITFKNAVINFTVSHVGTGKKVEDLNPPLSDRTLAWFYEHKAKADQEHASIEG